MQRLYKFLRFPPTHRRLLVTSVVLLGTIRLGLWLLPFWTLRRLLAGLTRFTSTLPNGEQDSIDNVTWAVTVASQYVPMATCLTQALATSVLLGRRGHVARLRIGVAKTAAGQFQAHAWVECQGRIVLGGVDAPSRFTPLPPLDGKRL